MHDARSGGDRVSAQDGILWNVRARSWAGLAHAALAVIAALLGARPRGAQRYPYILMISMPSMVALSVTVWKLITICPDVLAVVVNSRRTAL
jgi:hypothetical protein